LKFNKAGFTSLLPAAAKSVRIRGRIFLYIENRGRAEPCPYYELSTTKLSIVFFLAGFKTKIVVLQSVFFIRLLRNFGVRL